MEYVRDSHTYLNRIELIFWYFNEILRMQYSPTYNVKKELDKSQF